MKTTTKEIELGAKLTFLSDSEAKEFIDKYDNIIFLESNKRTRLPGMSVEDLAQECRIKLLAGFHSFDIDKSSEKTWAVSVIKKTLNSIWNQAFKKKRVCTVLDENNKEIPVRDYSIDRQPKRLEHGLTFEERYQGPPDNRPAFGTTLFSPEEYLQVLQALQFLKSKLSPESYDLIKQELFPDLDEKIEINRTEINYTPKHPKEYNIWSIFSELEENEIQILNQIADFFVHVLGFDREKILDRMKTIDIKID